MTAELRIRISTLAVMFAVLGPRAVAYGQSITVTSPNGAESWMVGESRTITWSATGTIANVKIESSTNGGAAWATVIASTPNDGSQPWTVPNTPSAQCLVRVSDASTPAVSDASNAVFAIVSDPTEPNDTSATATELPMGTTANLRFVGTGNADVDWYKVYVPPELAGQVLKVNLHVTSPYPDPPPANWRSDLDFDLLDGTLRLLGTVQSGSDNETLHLSNATPGWYYIYLGYATTQYADGLGVARYAVTVEAGADPGVGFVCGRVIDGNGQGIGGVYVRLQSFPYQHEVSFPIMTTASDGTFWLAHGPGVHDLSFAGDDGNSAHPAVNVVREYYRDRKTLAGADHVTVSAGQTLDVGDVTLEIGAIVSGRVTNTSGTPQSFAFAQAYDLDGNSHGLAYTDTAGDYVLKGVPVGGAKLRFSKSPYAIEFYNDKASLGSATALPTQSGQALTGIDAQLGTGGTISGTVRNASGVGIAIPVRLYSATDSVSTVASAVSAATTGNFTFSRVLPGEFVIRFDATGTSYASEWYADAASFALATPVTVTSGGTTAGIDVTLAAAPRPAAKLAAGESHTCALTTDGGVECWGENSSGQLGDGTTFQRAAPTPVTGLGSGVARIAAGGRHTCALTTGGAVYCWGRNLSTQLGDGTAIQRTTPTPVSGLGSGVAGIAAGGSHTCALTTGGGVMCWGNNASGQLGDGTTTRHATPTPVSGLGSGVLGIAAGANHTCALTTGGGLMCWGYNTSGQVGDGTTTNALLPIPVGGLGSPVTAVTAGSSHTCAVTAGGGMICWGANFSGQLGDGTTTNALTPTPVSGLASGVLEIVAGGNHTCAVTTGGSVKCWGNNAGGQLGNGTTTHQSIPTAPPGLDAGVTAITASVYHTCAVTSDGGVTCWGSNLYGQLGDGTTLTRGTPTAVTELPLGGSTVAAGGDHTCAVTADGSASCWGANSVGQLGDGTATTGRSTPGAVNGLGTDVAAISTGQYHSCALTTSGAVTCWGYNAYGQLGDGTKENRLTPIAVAGQGSGMVAVAAGATHTCGLTSTGGVTCWGRNSDGQLGDGTTSDLTTPTLVSGLGSGVAAITAGVFHTCALSAGGGVTCWGRNTSGQVGDGTTNLRATPTPVIGLASGVVAIVAGGYHACALLTGGAVRCWGSNSFGQLGDGTTTQRTAPVPVTGLSGGVAAIAAGSDHTCALSTVGTVQCWGRNSFGQLGDATTTNRLVPTVLPGLAGGATAIAAGFYHSCAVRSGGGVTCWGSDGSGQLGTGRTLLVTTPSVAYGFGGAMTASSIAPSHGSASGGTVVSITGKYFLQGAAVAIGGTAATDVSVVNPALMTARTGAHALGVVDVLVTNPDGRAARLPGAYTFDLLPTISAVTPTRGRLTGGSSVRVTGTGFPAGATVTVGGTAVTNVVVVSATSITFLTPSGTLGPAAVAVTTPGGTATLPGAFTYVPTPTFTDASLLQRVTPVRAVHVTELRQRVNELRARYGLPGAAWTDAALVTGQTQVKAVHITELRTALADVHVAAGRAVPTYSPPVVTARETMITAAQIAELRSVIGAIW